MDCTKGYISCLEGKVLLQLPGDPEWAPSWWCPPAICVAHTAAPEVTPAEHQAPRRFGVYPPNLAAAASLWLCVPSPPPSCLLLFSSSSREPSFRFPSLCHALLLSFLFSQEEPDLCFILLLPFTKHQLCFPALASLPPSLYCLNSACAESHTRSPLHSPASQEMLQSIEVQVWGGMDTQRLAHNKPGML